MVYYVSYLTFDDVKTGKIKDGYVYASFEIDDPARIWFYFKLANFGARSWALMEISERAFKTGLYKHYGNSITINVDSNFKEKVKVGPSNEE